MGGVINVIIKVFELGVFGGNLVGEYGNYDVVCIDGVVNVLLGDNVVLWVVGIFVCYDGYFFDGIDD